MLGSETLAANPQWQVFLCENPQIAAAFEGVEKAILTWELSDLSPEAFAGLKNRDVVCFGDILPMIFIHQSGPSRLRLCTDPLPDKISREWLTAPNRLKPWPEIESAAQASTDLTGKPPLAKVQPVAADPLREELREMYADTIIAKGIAANADDDEFEPDEDRDPGEPPEYVTEGPESALPRVNGHNGHNGHDSHRDADIWVKRQDDGWGHPVDLFADQTPPAELNPDDMLPGFIADYVRDCCTRNGTDFGIGTVAALVGLSAWCYESYSLQVKTVDTGWRESARLWGFVLGSSADGKSPGMKAIIKPIVKLDERCAEDDAAKLKKWLSEKRVYEKQVADVESERAKNKVVPDPSEVPDIEVDSRLISDYTTEGLRSMLEKTPKAFVFSDEASTWVGSFSRYSAKGDNGDRAYALQLFEGGKLKFLRAARPYVVNSWSASILVGGTKDSLLKTLGRDLHTDGLLQRFLICCCRDQRADTNTPPDMAALNAFTRCVNRLRGMRPLNDLPLHVSDAAYEEYRAFHDRVMGLARAGIYSSACQSHLSKCRSFAPRIALVLHLAMRAEQNQETAPGEMIADECMSMAIQLCEKWIIPHAIYFWENVVANGVELNKNLRIVAEVIACFRLSHGYVTFENINNSWKDWKHLEPREQAKILSVFEDMQWIRPHPKAKAKTLGMVSRYELNPALSDSYEDHPAVITAKQRRMTVAGNFAAMRAH